jgi:hypothetical protein
MYFVCCATTLHTFLDTLPPCRVVPRRKAGKAIRASSEPIVLTRDELSVFFNRPLSQSAIDLGIGESALKKLCRKLELPLPPALSVSGATLLKRRLEIAVPVRVTLGIRT